MVAGAAHLGEHLVQPLQGPVQVDLDPARSRSHVLEEKTNINRKIFTEHSRPPMTQSSESGFF